MRCCVHRTTVGHFWGSTWLLQNDSISPPGEDFGPARPSECLPGLPESTPSRPGAGDMRESDFPAVLARPAPILAPEAAESMDMVTIHWKSMDFQWKSMDFDEKPWFCCHCHQIHSFHHSLSLRSCSRGSRASRWIIGKAYQ